MSNFCKGVIFIIAFTNLKVSGLDFTLNKERVLLGSTGTLTMTCDVTETDVVTIYLIEIRRLTSTTSSGTNPADWQTLALMELKDYESPTLTQDITAVAASKDYVAGGSWDSDTPANTYLTLSMNIEKLVCNDARAYRCELSYKSSTANAVTASVMNSSFSGYVKPQVTSLITRKNGFIVEGMSASNMATAEVGDELELTCTAIIGSLPETIIRWHKTSETSQNDDFIGYQAPQGMYNEGTGVSDNQCGYTRVATTRYNTTASDANRDNNLAFECYVTVSGDPYPGNSYTSENNPRFYTDVTGSVGGQTGTSISTTDKNEECLTAGVIAAIVIALFTVGVLIGVALTWVNLSRKQIIKGRTEQSQHHTTSISRETELTDTSHLPNTYEQLQNRADAESILAYDSLNANSSAIPNSQSQYESLKQGAGTSHTYAGLKYNR